MIAPTHNYPTAYEQLCLRMLKIFWEENDYSPTFSQLARMMGRSTPGVQHAIQRLKEFGYVLAEPRTQRTLRLTDSGRNYLHERGQ